jgi:NAD(P)-dependent dehydrogenase (short-subunit alcohol dehydrogenase family)
MGRVGCEVAVITGGPAGIERAMLDRFGAVGAGNIIDNAGSR